MNDRGNRGDHGEGGDHGDPGNQGDRGDHGDQGNQGDRGDHGDHRKQGDHGNRADHGEYGDHDDHGDRTDQGDSGDQGAINFRSGHYWIARTAGVCPHCHGETVLVALMLPPHHEVLSTDEEDSPAGDASTGGDRWDSVPRHAFLFYAEFLSDQVRGRVQTLAPTYRFAASPATQGSYWANHCARCGAFQEDHELFCEPEGAFSPLSPASAARIFLSPVSEALEVSAAGYALDPQYLELEA